MSAGGIVAVLSLWLSLFRVGWWKPSTIPSAVFSLRCRSSTSSSFSVSEEVPVPKSGGLVSSLDANDPNDPNRDPNPDRSERVPVGAAEAVAESVIGIGRGATVGSGGGVTVMTLMEYDPFSWSLRPDGGVPVDRIAGAGVKSALLFSDE